MAVSRRRGGFDTMKLSTTPMGADDGRDAPRRVAAYETMSVEALGAVSEKTHGHTIDAVDVAVNGNTSA